MLKDTLESLCYGEHTAPKANIMVVMVCVTTTFKMKEAFFSTIASWLPWKLLTNTEAQQIVDVFQWTVLQGACSKTENRDFFLLSWNANDHAPGEFLVQDYDIKPLHLLLQRCSKGKNAIVSVTFNLRVKGAHIYLLYGTFPTAQTVTMAIRNIYLVIILFGAREKQLDKRGWSHALTLAKMHTEIPKGLRITNLLT